MGSASPDSADSDALHAGPDGCTRCFWAAGAAADYLSYHDLEWGRPVRDDDMVFERLCLEAFQSGLSWLTILRKRESFRAAFAGFHIPTVAAFGSSDVERLLLDPRIVRNRRKVEAAITNAGAAVRLTASEGSLAAFLWTFRPKAHRPPRMRSDFVTTSPESIRLAGELRRRGFRFVGPTTMYALMQAIGLVNDHVPGCCAFAAVAADQDAMTRRLG